MACFFTFYSFKGGVGRSMAMANVADILARRGLRVLAIDFDLEAPGLERYFQVEKTAALANPGLIDLLQSFKKCLSGNAPLDDSAEFRQLERFIFPIFQQPLDNGGTLHLMTAGQREPAAQYHQYALAVRTFDWQDFYDNWEGQTFFKWLRSQLSERFSGLPFNTVSGSGRIGILASGVSALYVKEAVETVSDFEELFTLFRIGTVYPFPEKAVLSSLRGIDRLIVAEELDPYLEEQVLQLIGKAHLPVEVYGKKNGFFPVSGEYNVDLVIDSINSALAAFGESLRLSHASPAVSMEKLPPLPIRAPTLCAGCMHRTVFYAFKQAAKQFKKEAQTDTIFSGDIGCYTLGNAYPLNMVDTCLCMGAGVSIAGGLFRTNPKAKHVAFIGDSTFFHSGIPALVNVVYNGADITLAVLDNRTTAMTGHQPHPGIGLTALGSASKAIEIADVVRSCGVEFVRTVNTLEADSLGSCVKTAKEAMNFKGPSVIVFKGRCAGITKSDRYYRIKSDDCTGCGFCIKELGCPAISLDSDKPVINDSCIGCGLCAQICPSEAICIGGGKL